jgi:hypothetical protein
MASDPDTIDDGRRYQGALEESRGMETAAS